MFKRIALFTTLAVAATTSIAMASPSREDRTGYARFSTDYRTRDHARGDRFDEWHRRGEDLGPRRYRSSWVALGAPHRRPGGEYIEVHDRGTFTQLRLQSDSGIADVDRVIVEFADGSHQVADVDRALDRRGEFVEIPLDGNNRRIARVIVIGAARDLQVFAI